MKATSFLLLAVLLITAASSGFALDEQEPNDSFATGNDATRETVIRGVIEPGAGYREDFFMIHRFNTFFFDLVAEARIVSGPFAGSESFDFRHEGRVVPPYTNIQHPTRAFPSGNGSLTIGNRSSPIFDDTPRYAPLYLILGFPPGISSGEYEVRYKLTAKILKNGVPQFIIEEPVIEGKRVSVKIIVDSGNCPMHRLTARATGNQRSSIISNYFGTSYINTKRGPNHSSSTRFELDYKFQIDRRITKVAILAEDSAGSVVMEELVFVTNPRRPKEMIPRISPRMVRWVP